jgi:hypothetical protein
MLQFLCGKWHGSDDRMMDFARRASAGAPPGSHIHVLIAEAHLEACGTVWRERGKKAGAAYWADPAVRSELVRANDKCFNSGGFHLGGPLFEPVIGDTVEALARLDPDVIVPAHCTGWRATQAIAGRLPDAFIPNSVGTSFALTGAPGG